MTIEIVDYYPLEPKQNDLAGNLRVRHIEKGIEILGVFVAKKKNFWYFQLPGKKTKHVQTGQDVWYPHLDFGQGENKKILQEIKDKGIVFIENWILNKEKPKVIETYDIKKYKVFKDVSKKDSTGFKRKPHPKFTRA